jgi:UDP-3-O-[3-hydroxymyristoyl] N-acetylglucosamine deacetylase
MPYQLTIQRPVEARGVGLHTAVQCRLRLLPAPADTGIVFRRVDLDNFEIEAHVRNVARVSYATSLMKQGVLLSTVEHLLAALYSCGVDNVYVEIDALELPILDGSSKPFIELLAKAVTSTWSNRWNFAMATGASGFIPPTNFVCTALWITSIRKWVRRKWK